MTVHTFGSRQFVAVIAALVAFSALAVPSAGAQDPPSTAPSGGDAPALLSAPDASRSATGDARDRVVDVNASVLVPDTAVTVAVDAFSDASFTADLEPFDGGVPGWHAWTGPVQDVADGTATFIRRGDEVSGIISTPDGSFRVQRRGEGNVVREVADDLSARQTQPDALIPPEGGLATPDSEQRPVPDGDRGAVADPSNRVIDVLVAYTPAARSQMGGKSAIEAEAAMSIAVTNTAYVDSGVDGSVRLVGVMETSTNLVIDDEGDSLLQLTDPGDGVVDEVPRRRDALGADLVSLLTATNATYCGLGWYLSALAGDPVFGYSQVAWDCAVDDMAFAHELGHNMGLDHDRYVSSGPYPDPSDYPPVTYGFGYVDVAAGWRTIMAYNNECAAASKYCTRLARFSNPDQLYGGRPLGKPAGASNAADNRKALNITVPVVAGYRIPEDTPKLGFQPITPCRIVDTRSGGGSFRPGNARTFQVAGGGSAFASQGGKAGGCSIPATANAVEATITAVDPTSGGFARAYPAGTVTPAATFLNYVASQSIGNTGTIPIATSGSTADLAIKNYSGTTHYVIDVQGYFSDGAPLGYAPITPCRIVDTRAKGGSLSSGDARTFQVAGGGSAFTGQGGKSGGCNVPADAKAVETTITAVGPGSGGFARAYPAGTATPGATFLNFVRRQSIGNTGTVPIATSGSSADLTVKNYGGSTHYVIDIQGYFSPSAPLGYVSVTPCRVGDSRYTPTYFGPGETRSYQVVGSAGDQFWNQGGAFGGCRVPPSAAAVETTITSVTPFGDGFARAYPAGTGTPGATFLNYAAGQPIGNTGTVPIATSSSLADLVLKNYGAVTDYVIDVQGFFAPR